MSLALALVAGAALVWSCVGAVGAADDARGAGSPGGAAPILLEEGGILRPIVNGGRVQLRRGWATVRFDRVPIPTDSTLVVALFDASGAAAAGDVTAEYEALDMDHGRALARATAGGGAHRLRLSFEMPGQWRVSVRVTRAGEHETFTIVLPLVGL